MSQDLTLDHGMALNPIDPYEMMRAKMQDHIPDGYRLTKAAEERLDQLLNSPTRQSKRLLMQQFSRAPIQTFEKIPSQDPIVVTQLELDALVRAGKVTRRNGLPFLGNAELQLHNIDDHGPIKPVELTNAEFFKQQKLGLIIEHHPGGQLTLLGRPVKMLGAAS